MTLLDVIKEASLNFKGKLGVSVKHLGTRETASLRGDELFPTASVFKVPVVVELYRQVESGVIHLDEKVILRESEKVPGSGVLKELSDGLVLSIRDLIELMMILSDNTATDLLLERVGRNNVNATLRRLGLKETTVIADCRDILFDLVGLDELQDEEKTIDLYREKSRGAKLDGTWALGVEKNNVTTPSEMLRLIEMIVAGVAASMESCKAILATMGRCQTGTYRIAKYLPSEKVRISDKTGSLPGIRNDVGAITIIETGELYLLSCFTKEADDNFEADEAIANVSKNIYEYFTQ